MAMTTVGSASKDVSNLLSDLNLHLDNEMDVNDNNNNKIKEIKDIIGLSQKTQMKTRPSSHVVTDTIATKKKVQIKITPPSNEVIESKKKEEIISFPQTANVSGNVTGNVGVSVLDIADIPEREIYENDLFIVIPDEDKKLLIDSNIHKHALIKEIIRNENEYKKYDNDDLIIMLNNVELLKQNKKYKIMKQKGKLLLDIELIALYYYSQSNSACHKIKTLSHRILLNINKWKQLYDTLINGIEKIYQIFHFKNDSQKQIFKLYHKSIDELLKNKSQQILCSFTTNFDGNTIDIKSGYIWIIDNAYQAIYSGQLKAVDITWISQENNKEEYIILPSKLCNWKEMSKDEIVNNINNNKWKIGK
eukprot:170018_1